MPVQYEINEQNSVLCFIPSGQNVDGNWVPFPTQEYNEGCTFSVIDRLASLTRTQNGKTEAQSEIIDVINATRLKIDHVLKAKQIILKIMRDFAQNNDDTQRELAKMQKLNLKTAKEILGANYDEMSPILQKFLVAAFVQPEIEFKKHLIKSVQIAWSLFDKYKAVVMPVRTNPELLNPILQQMSREVDAAIDEYFMQLESNLYTELFKHPAIPEDTALIAKIMLHGMDDISKKVNSCFYLTRKLYEEEIGCEKERVSIFAADGGTWLPKVSNILRQKGPFMMVGFVGLPYYDTDVKPASYKHLGSYELLSYPKAAYKETSKIAHAVLVIGLTDDKIIYVDPLQELIPNTPRKAYVMQVDSFMQRCIKYCKQNMDPFLDITYISPEKIDISEDLMLGTPRAASKRLTVG